MTAELVQEAKKLGVTRLVSRLSVPQGFGDATLRRRRPGDIELLGGIPDASALPVEQVLAAATRVLSDPQAGVASFQYSQTPGLDGLREWIAEREGVAPGRVLITNGGFHGLSLSVLALVERGGLVAVDNPIFPLFLRALELSDGVTLPIPVGPRGIDVDALEQALADGARPQALYTVPDFHNPSQGTLDAQGRRRLVELAERHNFVVLADNPYRELRFRGTDEDFSVFNDSDHVIHVNTFSKTLGPGLRLGWLVLPEHLVEAFIRLRNRQDSHTSTLEQKVVIDLLTTDPQWFDTSLRSARDLYLRRSDLLVHELRTQLPGALDIVDPEGGFFLWPRLTDDAIDPAALFEAAVGHGVNYQQGAFFASGEGTDSDRRLRLAYGNHSEEDLREAAARLARAYADVAR